MTHQRIARQTRGFTLTEAAIVLGIVGLILGAIWVAAASVYANLRTKQTSEQILQIAQAVRALHATSTSIPAGVTMLQLAKAGVVPKDMLDDATNPQFVRNVWGGNVTFTVGNQAFAGDTFAITFAAIPQQPCVDLAVRTTGAGRDAGLLGVAPGVIYNSVFPFSVQNGITACPSVLAAGNPLTFTFRLRA